MVTWTPQREKALVDLYAQYRNRDAVPINDLAQVLHMKPADVKSKAKELGLMSSPKPLGSRPVTAKSGKRADLDNRYFRSAWESNYARYLNFLVDKGEIDHWEYEPQEFEFPVKRGNRTYLPDFKVYKKDGTYVWHEVKGYMDKNSQVKLKRFYRYYPEEQLILINGEVMKSIKDNVSMMIPNWE